jgi:hypothetical protein
VLITWPSLLAAEGLPSDGWLNGKFDDFVTGVVVALLFVGLLAAGWLTPLRTVLVAVLLVGFGVPILYEMLNPTECPVGVSGMDCIPVSFGGIWALPGLLVVLVGRAVRRAAGLPNIPLLPAERG